jgi:recombinational DNA repair ATPase RecF
MIRIISILIEEFRGIKKLKLVFNGSNFAVCGRNGTGKSGVVDAIEFALSGNISRLSGEGSDRLSVKKHAPHVDARDNPELAKVTLEVYIPSMKKTVTIVRTVADPANPIVTPSDDHILAVLAAIEDHPELVLTRREIIRYVLATEGNRAQEVQAVLKLDRLEHVRSTLTTISNASVREFKSARENAALASQSLTKALGVAQLSQTEVLGAANAQRRTLGLPDLSALTATVSLKDGIVARAAAMATPISKETATKDVDELVQLIEEYGSSNQEAPVTEALTLCRELKSDPEALKALERDGFLTAGLAFIDEAHCPFCDDKWDLQSLRVHVQAKLDAIKAFRERRAQAEKLLEPVRLKVLRIVQLLDTISDYAAKATPAIPADSFTAYKADLQATFSTIRKFLPLDDMVGVLEKPVNQPTKVRDAIAAVKTYATGLPEPSKEDAARDFLVVSQERFEVYREARRRVKKAEDRATLASKVLDMYAQTSDATLTHLYKDVEKKFAEMYAELNTPDEKEFEAKLIPSIGKLGFDVNFYGRGFFPPGAYHSEGHQDAMGLCLYLALMSHVLKDNFTFAVLDDVLMSVDTGHRRAVCALLRRRFPKTQFILTTHDRVWLNHMRAEQLITSKALTHFHSWDVNTGPAFWHDVDVWDQINTELVQDRVHVAAELLRNYLEYISGELCDRLRARVVYKLDGRVELGDLLPVAYERMSGLLAKGKAAANSWNNRPLVATLTGRDDVLKVAYKATQADQWQVNVAVHYNTWASLDKKDFVPIATAFKALIDAFRCSEQECQSFLFVVRDGPNESAVTCTCGRCNFVLEGKS